MDIRPGQRKHLGDFACAPRWSRVQNTSMCAEEPRRAWKKRPLMIKPGFPRFCRWHAFLLVVLSIISTNVQSSSKSNYCLTLFRRVARSGTNRVLSSTMAVFRCSWLTWRVEWVVYWNLRVPFERGHVRRKRRRRGESVCEGRFCWIRDSRIGSWRVGEMRGLIIRLIRVGKS